MLLLIHPPQQIELMAALSGGMFTAPEGQEGMAAFREKRPPSWVKGE